MFLRRFLSSSILSPTIRQVLSSPPTSSSGSATLSVSGWIKSVRRQKRVAFAVLSDGSSPRGLQAVFADPTLAKSLTNGASVRLTGRLVDSVGPGQERELQVDEVELLGDCDTLTYPMQKQALSVEYLRDHCHFRPRTDANAAMLRLRSSAMNSLQTFFEREGFCYAHTPIITSNDCEGAGEAFRVSTDVSSQKNPDQDPDDEFFSRPSYLTVSAQLHLEALASSLSRVYTLSPCFRSERSMTSRHLAEFWMLEVEWAFVDCVRDVCDLVQAAAQSVLRDALLSPRSEDIDLLWRSNEERGVEGSRARRRMLEDSARTDAPWTRMTYTDAIKALQDHYQYAGPSTPKFEFEPAWGRALQSEHERWLAEHFVRGPVFVTDYPASLKPFYMRANDDGPVDGASRRTVACFDLLVPHVGELVGGSLREHRADVLSSVMAAAGLDGRDYEWYLDLRRFGRARSGGFGMGFERLIGWLGGIDNVRECIAMPRWNGRMLL